MTARWQPQEVVDVLREHVLAHDSLDSAIDGLRRRADATPTLFLPGGRRLSIRDAIDTLESWRPRPLPPGDTVVVYHATEPAVARRMATEGVIPQLKTPNLAMRRYERGERAEFAPGRGVSRGIYVGASPEQLSGYGRAVVEVRVPRHLLVVSPEQAALGETDPMRSLETVDGAVIESPVPAEAIEEHEGPMTPNRGRSDVEVRDRRSSQTAIDLVAHVDGKAVGNLHASEQPVGTDDAYTVDSIYVHPEFRRQGVAQAMWEAAAVEAELRGSRLGSIYRTSQWTDAFWQKQLDAGNVDLMPGAGMRGQDVYLLKRGKRMVNNPSSDIDEVFDEAFDRIEDTFPDVGAVEFWEDEAAGSDNGAGADRQFAYCKDGNPMVIAFAPKATTLSREQLVGLMRHEFGHALEYRFGVAELERRLGVQLPGQVERRADAIAEAVWGEPIVYDERLIQCVGNVDGVRPRPAHLPDEKAVLRPNRATDRGEVDVHGEQGTVVFDWFPSDSLPGYLGVAPDRDGVGGYLMADLVDFEEEPRRRLVVEYVEVDRRYRRQGVATRLYEEASRYAKANDAVLMSDSRREAEADAFWRKMAAAGLAEMRGEGERKRWDGKLLGYNVTYYLMKEDAPSVLPNTGGWSFDRSCPAGPEWWIDWVTDPDVPGYDEGVSWDDIESDLEADETFQSLMSEWDPHPTEDWHVTYYRTTSPSGVPLVVIQHSGIEHIWSERPIDVDSEEPIADASGILSNGSSRGQ